MYKGMSYTHNVIYFRIVFIHIMMSSLSDSGLDMLALTLSDWVFSEPDVFITPETELEL